MAYLKIYFMIHNIVSYGICLCGFIYQIQLISLKINWFISFAQNTHKYFLNSIVLLWRFWVKKARALLSFVSNYKHSMNAVIKSKDTAYNTYQLIGHYHTHFFCSA